MKLGVCYYPEHWPEVQWQEDAQRMVEQGITVVRLGEFAWSRFEPEEGQYCWNWMHRVLDIMTQNSLDVVMGTPTAAAPKWLVNKFPEILAVGSDGHQRTFGSRRHYCFSSPIYQDCSNRIVAAMVQEFGEHPAVSAWQTDNEFGCHDTIRSYSESACMAFRAWCERRYSDVEVLNKAWGNVFWSMEYGDFSEIDLPHQTVTEANPSHVLDFYRFSSDQACLFNRRQVDLIRAHSPGRDVLHNYMGYVTSFDHHKMGKDLDIAAWDSYPLGFLIQFERDEDVKRTFFRTGHPDDSAFHHDLYRGVGRGRLWIMEQQPGPVNWADYNAVPLNGMVRLWTLEGFAHGAEVVSYFRWRQAPFAQEQFHSALNLPDGRPADTSKEISKVNTDLQRLEQFDLETRPARVALLFDYDSEWVLTIARQGADYDPMEWVKNVYRSLRDLGLDIDIISSDQNLVSYQVVVIPNLVSCDSNLLARLKTFEGAVFIGPRSGSKTENLGIPQQLPPGLLQELIPLRVTKVESLPNRNRLSVDLGGVNSFVLSWREWVETDLESVYSSEDGIGIYYQHGQVSYLSACLDRDGVRKLLGDICHDAGLETFVLPEGVRLRRCGELVFLFNYGPEDYTIHEECQLVIGEKQVRPGAVAVWKNKSPDNSVIKLAPTS